MSTTSTSFYSLKDEQPGWLHRVSWRILEHKIQQHAVAAGAGPRAPSWPPFAPRPTTLGLRCRGRPPEVLRPWGGKRSLAHWIAALTVAVLLLVTERLTLARATRYAGAKRATWKKAA